MRNSRPCWPLIIAAVILVAVAGYFAVQRTAAKYAEPEKEFLVVGTSTPFPPFEMKNAGEVVGFDIDIAERIARALGRKLVIKDFTEFDALLPTLEAGGLDMIASALSIRSDRQEVVDFSMPYCDTAQGVLARKKIPIMSIISKPEDFKGLRIAYQKGTTSESWVKDYLLGISKASVKSHTAFSDMAYAIQLLRLGSFDVIVLDKRAAESFVKANPDLIVVGVVETGEQYGFAVRKDDPKKLLAVINRVITEMKEKGEYQELIKAWFGGGK